jgi:hypothetical protein
MPLIIGELERPAVRCPNPEPQFSGELLPQLHIGYVQPLTSVEE